MSDRDMSAPERRLSSPVRYLVRMLVFLALAGFLVFILQRTIREAFMANPGLNGLIVGVLLVGVLVALREVWRLHREARGGNELFAGGHPGNGGLPIITPIVPALAALERRRLGPAQAATILESIAVRLDEGRDTLRYLAGLLIFLGLLGTFWGLLETVSSVGGVINTLRAGGEAGAMFEELKAGLAAPLAGMGLSFSSSLFGVAGSLALGFLDLQLGQAQRRFRTQIEDWMATGLTPESGSAVAQPAPAQTVISLPPAIGAPSPLAADLSNQLQKLSVSIAESAGGGRQATQAMANLAEGIQGLVQHMRSEQQLIRDWVEAQSQREKDTRRLLEQLLSERSKVD